MAKLDGTNGLIQQYDYQVLTTAFSYTFAAGTQTLIINPAGTLATGTVTMPAAPADGMVIWITTTKQIVALTINGNTGQTLTSGVTSLAPNQSVAYIYRVTNTTWYPFETQMAQGNGPAFSVARSVDQSITQNAYTRINFDSENFDTGNCYNNTGSTVTLNGVSVPAYSFGPNVAGYYLFFTNLFNNPAGAGQYVSSIRKNGGNTLSGNLVNGSVGGGSSVSATILLYASGTSDYFDVVAYASTASPTIQGSSGFFGYMARSA